MLLDLRRFVRHISFFGIVALASGFCLVSPTAAGAHARTAHATTHLKSGVNEESSTGPLQEPTAEPPAAPAPPPGTSAGPPPTESSTGAPAAESSANTR